MQEASQHSTKDDCWVVIDGKVYDVTAYLDEHPGGDDVLLTATGKDAKEEFEDAGHSKDARDLMEEFCVGELDLSAATIPEPEVPSKKQKHKDVIQEMNNLPSQYWAVPVAIAGIAVVVGLLYLRRK